MLLIKKGLNIVLGSNSTFFFFKFIYYMVLDTFIMCTKPSPRV